MLFFKKKRDHLIILLFLVLNLLPGQAEEVRAASRAIWLQNFESSDTEPSFTPASANVEVKINTQTSPWKSPDSGSRRLLIYDVLNSGSPEKDRGSVLISAMHGPVDTREQDYLIIWIKDMQGNNGMKVSLLDAHGQETDFSADSWAEDITRKGEWHPYYVWLDDLKGTIDRSQITGIRLGQWNCGTYVLDNIYFDQVYVTSQLPGSNLENAELPVVSQGLPTAVTASPAPGSYHQPQQVELFSTAGTEIYYTLNGSDPTPGQTGTFRYERFLSFRQNTQIKAIALKDQQQSAVTSFAYRIRPYPVGADSGSGDYADFAVVELRNRDGAVIKDDGSRIYYTLDGMPPDRHKNQYLLPLKLQTSATLKAIAYHPDSKEYSGVSSFTYNIDQAKPATANAVASQTTAFSPFLKTDHKVIKNNFGTGDTVTLKGVNAGGWLVMEKWQCLTNAADQKLMLETFTERFGSEEKAGALLNLYQDNWWTTADFDRLKAEGANTIRLPITYLEMLDANGTLKDIAFERLDWFIAACQERQIYVIIDLHGAPGSQNGEAHSGDSSLPEGGDFFGNEQNIRRTINLWAKIAERYRDNPWVAGYDLLNEPTGAAGATQFIVYDHLYRAIRAVDQNHLIFIQSCWDPQHLPDPAFYDWQNVVYEYHFYGGNKPNDTLYQQQFLDHKVALIHQAAYDVPTLIGEFNFYDNPASWSYGLDTFDREGWSYTVWGYKAIPQNNSFGIYTADLPKVDIFQDDEDTIRQKWGEAIQTQYFVRNQPIADILKAHFQQDDQNKTKNLKHAR